MQRSTHSLVTQTHLYSPDTYSDEVHPNSELVVLHLQEDSIQPITNLLTAFLRAIYKIPSLITADISSPTVLVFST